MHFEWWMIGALGLFWIVSMVAHGHRSFTSGCTNTIAVLEQNGYIKVTEAGDIIGLSNQNQENDIDPD
jgi:hypothetical protein